MAQVVEREAVAGDVRVRVRGQEQVEQVACGVRRRVVGAAVVHVLLVVRIAHATLEGHGRRNVELEVAEACVGDHLLVAREDVLHDAESDARRRLVVLVVVQLVDRIALVVTAHHPADRVRGRVGNAQFLREGRDLASRVGKVVDADWHAVVVDRLGATELHEVRQRHERQVAPELEVAAKRALVHAVVTLRQARVPVGGLRLLWRERRVDPKDDRQVGRRVLVVDADQLRRNGLAAVLPAIDVEQQLDAVARVKVEQQPRHQVVHGAIPVTRPGGAALPPVCGLEALGETRRQRAAERAGDVAFLVELVEATVGQRLARRELVGGLGGDEVDGATGGVLTEQRALRSVQHLDAFEVEVHVG